MSTPTDAREQLKVYLVCRRLRRCFCAPAAEGLEEAAHQPLLLPLCRVQEPTRGLHVPRGDPPARITPASNSRFETTSLGKARREEQSPSARPHVGFSPAHLASASLAPGTRLPRAVGLLGLICQKQEAVAAAISSVLSYEASVLLKKISNSRPRQKERGKITSY